MQFIERIKSRIPRSKRDVASEYPDIEPDFFEAYDVAAPFTMTSLDRMYGLWQGVNHVVKNGIPGDLVECGVWRGGSSILAALALANAGDDDRLIWMYDTYEGMTVPTDRDVSISGDAVSENWASRQSKLDDPVVAYASLREVRENIAQAGIPEVRVKTVVGPVEETIPSEAPAEISLLRLDTDWYESTKHELEFLWPRLSPRGVIIVDDYGHWSGARQAVDEFFEGREDAPLFSRLDYTGRIGVKSA